MEIRIVPGTVRDAACDFCDGNFVDSVIQCIDDKNVILYGICDNCKTLLKEVI